MIHIEEVPIKGNQNPIFIDYAKIYGNSRKRLRFLRALLKIVDSKEDFIHYDQLDLESEEIEQFKLYLKERYPDNFRLKRKTFNKDDFKGKIICNIDLLINDIFEIDSQNPDESGSLVHTSTQIDENKINIKKTASESHQPFHETYLEKTSHRYLNAIFHEGISEAETSLFVNKIFKESNPNALEKIFIFSEIGEEINKIPYAIKNGKLTYEDASQLRNIVIKILKKIKVKSLNKPYWEELILQTENQFNLTLIRCDQHNVELISENGMPYNVTMNEILLNDNMKIFIAEEGDPDINDRNSVISKYHGKIAVFNFKFSLSSKIQPEEYVLVELEEDAETYVKINPLKILNYDEVQQLIKAGMELFPSSNNLYSHDS